MLNDESGNPMDNLSRRRFMSVTMAVAGLAATGALVGCSRTESISTDPNLLTLWYWKRSISEKLLDSARRSITGTPRRLRTDLIGGDFDVKLRTSLAGRAYVPDITGLNSNVALYFPSEDQFVDMNELVAQEHKADYLPWKWQFGVTPTGRMCFWPMDTGPTAQFYRTDLFAAASLPRDPDEVAATTNTWPAWLEAGKKLKRNSGVSLLANASIVYSQIVNASAERYFSPAGRALFQDPGGTIRRAWDVAVAAAQAGITAKVLTPAEQNSAWVSGKVASHIEAVWWGPILKSTAPNSSGKWAVAHQPGAPGNSGGSFLAIPKSCKDPKAAFDFITWLTSPEAQIQTYEDVQLFPSAPKAFESPRLSSPDKFFGGQDVLGVFQESAKEVPITFISPYDSQVSEGVLKELTNVETQGKDPDRAWADAMNQGIRQLEKRGLMK